MSRCFVAMAFTIAVTGGCGSKHDTEPTVLGMNSTLRAEMRQLIAEQDPDADVDQVVDEYMDNLRRTAQAMGVEPNQDGDYLLPDEMKAITQQQGGTGDVLALLDEFDLRLPDWAAPLLVEYKQGNITPPREELLRTVVLAKLAAQMAG